MAVIFLTNSPDSKIIEYGRYIAKLIASSVNNSTPPEAFDGIDWEVLYQCATFHNVSALIFPSVSKLSVPAEVMDKFKYDNYRMVAREARQELESRRIFKLIGDNGIPFIKLKGITIKNIYPLPYMRTHSDIDICVSPSDRERCKQIMKDAGYKLDSSIDYHDEYSKDNFFIYEIHSSVMSLRSPFYSMFDDPFSKTKRDSDNTGYVFTDEYFYLSLFIHLYKHFISEGCGIRLFSDLYVFSKNHPDLDMGFIRDILKNYGLIEFYGHITRLCELLFDGGELDGRYAAISEFIFRSGEYGSPELKRISWISSDKSANISFSDKTRYFLGNWFPGVKVMSKRHPVLNKAPFLLPFFWIHRGFYTLFRRPHSLRKQRDEIKKMNSDEIKTAKHVRNLAGIK